MTRQSALAAARELFIQAYGPTLFEKTYRLADRLLDNETVSRINTKVEKQIQRAISEVYASISDGTATRVVDILQPAIGDEIADRMSGEFHELIGEELGTLSSGERARLYDCAIAVVLAVFIEKTASSTEDEQ